VVAFTVVIPARYGSTRFPGKLLKDLNGKSVLHRVYECVKKSSPESVIVATDSKDIVKAVNDFGGDVCMTAETHESGTQRIAEVIRSKNISANTIIVNVQGDEPFMPAICIEQVAKLLADNPDAVMATLSTPLTSEDEVFDSNVVKVVSNQVGEAMYFSRAPIPWCRGHYEEKKITSEHLSNTFRHIGIYAYRASFIQQYIDYLPSPLEDIEMLEQLRVLWYGHKIIVDVAAEIPGPGIDVPADLEKAKVLLSGM